MQNLKPAKEFRALIANEESLDALLEIKGHLEHYLPEESGNDKRALAYLWTSTGRDWAVNPYCLNRICRNFSCKEECSSSHRSR